MKDQFAVVVAELDGGALTWVANTPDLAAAEEVAEQQRTAAPNDVVMIFAIKG